MPFTSLHFSPHFSRPCPSLHYTSLPIFYVPALPFTTLHSPFFTSLPFTSLHFTPHFSRPCPSLRYTSLPIFYVPALPFTTLHSPFFTSLPFTSLHFTRHFSRPCPSLHSPFFTSLPFPSLHFTPHFSRHSPSLHYTSLPIFHVSALPFTTLHSPFFTSLPLWKFRHHVSKSLQFWLIIIFPNPLSAGPSSRAVKAWFYGCSPAEIVGSNPTEAWICVVLCVVR